MAKERNKETRASARLLWAGWREERAPSLADALREAEGRGPADSLLLAPGEKAAPEWAQRAGLARRAEARSTLLVAASWLLAVSIGVSSAWAMSAAEWAGEWALALRAWSQEGALLLEREKLADAAA